jgi:hypothetical protein
LPAPAHSGQGERGHAVDQDAEQDGGRGDGDGVEEETTGGDGVEDVLVVVQGDVAGWRNALTDERSAKIWSSGLREDTNMKMIGKAKNTASTMRAA